VPAALRPVPATNSDRVRLVASTALRISRVRSPAAKPSTRATPRPPRSAFPRSAMNRFPAGGMARSSVPGRYPDGMDRHPGGPEGVAAPGDAPRSLCRRHHRRRLGVDVGSNASGNASRSRYRSTPRSRTDQAVRESSAGAERLSARHHRRSWSRLRSHRYGLRRQGRTRDGAEGSHKLSTHDDHPP
jgi:hypothetical protein